MYQVHWLDVQEAWWTYHAVRSKIRRCAVTGGGITSKEHNSIPAAACWMTSLALKLHEVAAVSALIVAILSRKACV